MPWRRRPSPADARTVLRFVGQAWKGKGENAQTNEEAVKVILATVGIYTAFLVASCARAAGWGARGEA